MNNFIIFQLAFDLVLELVKSKNATHVHILLDTPHLIERFAYFTVDDEKLVVARRYIGLIYFFVNSGDRATEVLQTLEDMGLYHVTANFLATDFKPPDELENDFEDILYLRKQMNV